MPYLNLSDARVFFTDEGPGPTTLVLIHGLGSDSHDWDWLIPQLHDRYRVVTLDLRGHGRSGPAASYSLADAAADVLGIADQLGCARFIPVGHSLGGAIAARLAVEQPDRVQAAVEVDPAYAMPPFVVELWEADRARWKDMSAKIPDLLLSSPVMPPFLRTRILRQVESMDATAFWKTYEGLANGPENLLHAGPDAEAYLCRRKCPVLAIHALPGRGQWESALFDNAASHAIEWEGSSHYLHVERSQELAVVLSGWLETVLAEEAATSA